MTKNEEKNEEKEEKEQVKDEQLPLIKTPDDPVDEVVEEEAAEEATEDDNVPKRPAEDDYEIIKLISNGAYGAVFLVRHKETRQRFAMKKINKSNLVMRNQLEQVFAERDIMSFNSFTDNPFVVSMFCSFETKKHLCMVMEYVEGGDCATLLKNMGPLPFDLARFYFAETVLAVEYLHNYGIVHRDLKPDNLLITAMGHIKLTDFGLSKIGLINLATNLCEGYDKETRQFKDKQVCGTPEYIAPEVILRQGYGTAVDWWSMGIILYEFLIGCVPFFGETPEELFAHVINDEIEWPDDEDWPLSEEAKDLISKLLQRNPMNRLGTLGANEVKDHSLFSEISWQSLLREKVDFVPQLEDEEDTSYFDTREDRYNHDFIDSEETEDTDDSAIFSSFSSCSPRYRKVYSRIEKELEEENRMRLSSSSSSSSLKDETLRIKYCRNDSTAADNIITRSTTEVDKPTGFLTPTSSFDTPTKSQRSQSTSKVPLLRSTPESSQTESDEVSPQMYRRKKSAPGRDSLLRFSFSSELDVEKLHERRIKTPPILTTDFSTDESRSSVDMNMSRRSSDASSAASYNSSKPSYPIPARISVTSSSPTRQSLSSRAVIKSASASGLSLIISSDEGAPKSGGLYATSSGGSNTSSRDASPNREMNPFAMQLKPPVIIRKGPRGFGFTLRAIRVYYGDSDVYTIHHLVLAVENNSPAFDAGLRPGDLITHINEEPVQGLLHHQVLQLILSGGAKVHIRTTPLDKTTIKPGGRKRNPITSKMARRRIVRHRKAGGTQVKRRDSDKRRRSSLLRRLSSKRASLEIQQLMATSSGANSPPVLDQMSPTRSFMAFRQGGNGSFEAAPPSPNQTIPILNLRSSPSFRLSTSFSQSDSSPASLSSSPNSSVPNSPASLSHYPHFPRPNTLHGLKNKLVKPFRSPRRNSCGHIPLSPLARTPSLQVLPLSTSPTRSPSPLAFPAGNRSQGAQTCVIRKNSSTTLKAIPIKKPSPDTSTPTIIKPPIITANSNCCSICKRSQFNVINRKHRCRKCSSIVCGSCSKNKYLLPEKGSKPVRVCNTCYDTLCRSRVESFKSSIKKQPSSTVTVAKEGQKEKENTQKDSGSKESSSKEISPENEVVINKSLESSDSDEESKKEVTAENLAKSLENLTVDDKKACYLRHSQ